MRTQDLSKRGAVWLDALTGSAPLRAGYPPSVRVADARLGDQAARFIAVLPDPNNPFPRARGGEVGLVEAWEIARAVREVIDADTHREEKRALVAVIDVASQAYGRREEAYGIHQALAGAADAYASARLARHPVIGLIVGRAMSGAFLAHGYQANRLIALADPRVMVHAMGKESAARVTLRSVAELEAFTERVPPMAYDIDNYASLGLLWKLLPVSNADAPTGTDQSAVEKALKAAVDDIRADPSRGLESRLRSEHRAASAAVRRKLREAWR
ncbi:malonate decarboxylase subunit gamma [Caballeronia fortuita]|uniref:Malonate decarboxylase subunit gamma n=1 Tax=Caballeronia fortuita TaxID=1777138 RepID=A0A158CT99_9BURK|nr:biotin-independent malonate decarboxylase subunit gamma [Caballeronia fortuita]SAK85615.1 malonate decarboxylase subunit gamma [Caballeronia fortuita]